MGSVRCGVFASNDVPGVAVRIEILGHRAQEEVKLDILVEWHPCHVCQLPG
jgi:hypothetical protein